MPALPCDISAIPYFAWVPGLGSWLAVLAFGALLIYLTERYNALRRRQKEKLDPFLIAQRELEKISQVRHGAKAELGRLSLTLRRLLSVAAAFPADNLTLQEISALATKSKSAASLQIALLLQSLETALYGPREVEAVFVREAVRQALTSVQELKLEKSHEEQISEDKRKQGT